MNWKIHTGDCLDVLRTMPDESVDAVVTDPPYGLAFMGKRWDYDVPSVEAWAECLRVLKPGGHLLAFFGTRTYHRGVVRVEDAGFEIRDCIAWLYGQGFPKSHNLKGDWSGWGTALKPAMEPIVVARKPLCGTVAENVLRWGTGAVNIDGCRVDAGNGRPWIESKSEDAKNAYGNGLNGSRYAGLTSLGRWPANVVHDGSDEVVGLFPDTTSGQVKSHHRRQAGGKDTFHNSRPKEFGREFGGDTGSAARFFYCAKASKAERGSGNGHPTVKPVALMAYLCRLVTPLGGVVLDPFTGSGSTGVACVREGFDFIGIEREPEYVRIAEARIQNATKENG